MQPLVVAVIGIPFLGGVVCLAVRDRASKAAAIATTVLTAAAAIALSVDLRSETWLFGEMPWLGRSAGGFFGYQIDPLTSVMLLVSSVIGVAIAVYSTGYLSAGNADHSSKGGQARYNFWLMLFIGAVRVEHDDVRVEGDPHVYS